MDRAVPVVGDIAAGIPISTASGGQVSPAVATDGTDFLIWQRQLGLGGPAVAAAGAVPEPTTAWLLAIGAAAWACRRR